MTHLITSSVVFFFNDTATTEIYTLSLHDALPICATARTTTASGSVTTRSSSATPAGAAQQQRTGTRTDRKSTRLNSSHSQISYAVFCLKKKKQEEIPAVIIL